MFSQLFLLRKTKQATTTLRWGGETAVFFWSQTISKSKMAMNLRGSAANKINNTYQNVCKYSTFFKRPTRNVKSLSNVKEWRRCIECTEGKTSRNINRHPSSLLQSYKPNNPPLVRTLYFFILCSSYIKRIGPLLNQEQIPLPVEWQYMYYTIISRCYVS